MAKLQVSEQLILLLRERASDLYKLNLACDLKSLIQVHKKLFNLATSYNLTKEDKEFLRSHEAGQQRLAGTWHKQRSIISDPDDENLKYYEYMGLVPRWIIAYSELNAEDFTRVEQAINKYTPEFIRQQSADEQIKSLTDLYVNLDYLHKFFDGNSRTIRNYVTNIAKQANILIKWHLINKNDFFIARDKKVAKKVIKYHSDSLYKDTMRATLYDIEQYEKSNNTQISLEKMFEFMLFYTDK